MEQAQAKREKPSIELVRASELTPEPISWLWPGWLPLGKLVLLAGAPGTGKTTAALSFAATVTAGGSFPDGSLCPVGDVLIWSGEDDPTDTLAPRLIAAGANQDRIYFVGNVDPQGERRPFDPAADTAKLLEAAQGLPDLRLVIFDPVVNAVTGNSHQNTEVRRGLQPLVDFAARAGAVLVGITHYVKGGDSLDPTKRVIGSVAFTAVARVVLGCAKNKDKEGNERRILARSKSNLGPDDGGFTYSLEQVEALPGIPASRTVWGESVEGSARELLAEPGADDDLRPRERAQKFLRECLAAGLTPCKTVQAAAQQAGISSATLRRAADALGVRSVKGGMADAWFWSLPTAEGAHFESKIPIKESEHLRDDLSAFGATDDSGEEF
jgi:putative DNA primase/helicase